MQSKNSEYGSPYLATRHILSFPQCFDLSKPSFLFHFLLPSFFVLRWSRVNSGLVEVGSIFGGAQIVCWAVGWACWSVSRGLSLSAVWEGADWFHRNATHSDWLGLLSRSLSPAVRQTDGSHTASCRAMSYLALKRERGKGGWLRKLARTRSAVGLTLLDSQDDLTLLISNILTSFTTTIRCEPSKLTLKRRE